jgi:surfactin synthase thioesterase subunit
MKSSPWVLRRSGLQRQCRLFCFAYAGGSATHFADWQAALGPSIEVCAVQLPGRGARFHEAPISDLSTLIPAIAAAIDGYTDLPFAFFGHSMGGLLAFELTRHLRRHRLPMPQHLFVSGCAAVRYRREPQGTHLLDDAALCEKLKEYNGTPPEILANDELMSLVLPTIRADFAIGETYKYQPEEPLQLAISVLAGKMDDFTSPEQVHGWQEETQLPCEIAWFDGDHFFIHSQRRQVLDYVYAVLAPQVKHSRTLAQELVGTS